MIPTPTRRGEASHKFGVFSETDRSHDLGGRGLSPALMAAQTLGAFKSCAEEDRSELARKYYWFNWLAH